MLNLSPGLKVKLESVRKLIRRGARVPLEKLLSKLHPADIAVIYTHLGELESNKLWSYIPDKNKLADIIAELEDHQIINFFETKKADFIADVVENMENDDASYVMRLLPDDTSNEVLNILGKEELADVEKLLSYTEDTAGSIMNTNYFYLNENITVKEATKLLHKAKDIEMVFYLYVTDDDEKLVGVISLRQLILNQPEKPLGEIMTTDVINVRTDVDQEDVAKLVEKYDLLAIPVVDEYNVLCGIITVDDVIDIIREEATEDIYRMAGTSDEELLLGSNSLKIARVRFPWLMVPFVGTLLLGGLISYFQGRMKDFALLVPFMPIIMAMAGNMGSQSATILIRGIALGKIDPREIGKVVMKELRVGLILGIACGILLGLFAPFWSGKAIYGVIVGIAMFSSMSIAALLGAFVPTTLIKFNFDPAVASGPFITMLNDITGLVIYFSVSMALMNYFG